MINEHVSSFVAGFSKIAAPRWMKELKKNPGGFSKAIGNTYATGSSQWGQMAERVVQSAHKNPARARQAVGEYVFGIQPSRVHKNYSVMRNKDVHSLSLQSPERRSAYFKTKHGWYKQLASVKETDPQHKAQMDMKSHLDALRKDLPSSLKDSGEKARRYLEGTHGSKPGFSYKIQPVGSKRDIEVKHLTPKDNAHLLDKTLKRSPSAASHHITHKGLFTFPAHSADSRLFLGGLSEEEAAKQGIHTIKRKIPEKYITYLPPSTRPSEQKDAELYISEKGWKAGKKKLG